MIARLYENPNALYITQDETKAGYSLKALTDFALTYGITLSGVEVEEKSEIKEAKFPFIALLQKSETVFHYVLVTKVKWGNVYYLDPEQGESSLSKKSFFKLWTGTALMITDFTKKDVVFNISLPENKDKGIITMVFQLFTAVFLVIGIYFSFVEKLTQRYRNMCCTY